LNHLPSTNPEILLVTISREPHHPHGATLESRPGDVLAGDAETFSVAIFLRGRSSDPERQLAVHARPHLDREAYSQRHAANPPDIALVTSYARDQGLTVTEVDAGLRTIILSGNPSNFSTAFHIDFIHMRGSRGAYRSHRNPVQVPANLAPAIEAVVGLDNRRIVHRHASVAATVALGTRPADVAKYYSFPEGSGEGQCIGVIELGGGYYDSDLRSYFSSLGLPVPAVVPIDVDGGSNSPVDALDLQQFVSAIASERTPSTPSQLVENVESTVETTMDIELVGALANGASINVYFAPQTNLGIFNALRAALNEFGGKVDVISCSWGGIEEDYEPGDRAAIDQLLQAAALRGIPFCCSSGDNGDESQPGGQPHVTYPSSSPYSIACGGTHLDLSSDPVQETVWSEQYFGSLKSTGGGISVLYDSPVWQQAAGVPAKMGRRGRGVPDLAAKADLKDGYHVCIGGQHCGIAGGTSAAAPLVAALLGIVQANLGSQVGCIAPLLYLPGFRGATRDIISGTNGQYQASPGWNACTGWGSPVGTALLAALRTGSTQRM
jgi:kumamolisin